MARTRTAPVSIVALFLVAAAQSARAQFGPITLTSVDSNGVAGNGESRYPSISEDSTSKPLIMPSR